jgi:hypothetical protein
LSGLTFFHVDEVFGTHSGSAEAHGTALHDTCKGLTYLIDELAGQLTGQRDLFHAKPHGGNVKVKNS